MIPTVGERKDQPPEFALKFGYDDWKDPQTVTVFNPDAEGVGEWVSARLEDATKLEVVR